MHSNGHHHHEPLPPPTETATDGYLQDVMDALGDTPETVISLHFLREGHCEVLCVGEPSEMEGVILQSSTMPEEPSAFGSSAEAIASLVPHLEGWAALNVPADLAADLIESVAAAAGVTSVRMLDDIYFASPGAGPDLEANEARLLTSADESLIRSAGALLGEGANRLLATLDWGFAAGVVREGQLVSLAHTFARSDRHMDIGVSTLEAWRGHGFATMTGALVSREIASTGRIPVWSTGGTNLASLRVAEKLGFLEVGRRVYLIPEFDVEPSDAG